MKRSAEMPAKRKVARIRKEAEGLGWPKDRLDTLARCLNGQRIGEITPDWIEMVGEWGTTHFFRDKDASLRWAHENATPDTSDSETEELAPEGSEE